MCFFIILSFYCNNEQNLKPGYFVGLVIFFDSLSVLLWSLLGTQEWWVIALCRREKYN